MPEIANQRFPIKSDGTLMQVAIASWIDNGSWDQTASYPKIERVVIVLHGGPSAGGADAINYCARSSRIAANTEMCKHTLLIVPQFITVGRANEPIDENALAVESALLYWGDGRFWGSVSANSPYHRAACVSSFGVIDQIVSHLADTKLFPNLERITIAGHSAGGQFCNRYAACGGAEGHHVPIRYVCMNPASYLYFSPERPLSSSAPQYVFDQPDTNEITRFIASSNSPNLTVDDFLRRYNRWGFGLEMLDQNGFNYISAVGVEQMVAGYPGREVVYLGGGKDVQKGEGGFQPSTMAQGKNRLQRMRAYRYHLEKIFGEAIIGNHTFEEVPDAGHSDWEMMSSAAGIREIFG